MRKAIVRTDDGFVVNVIEIKNKSSWTPPKGSSLIDAKDGSPGDTWDGKQFIKPPLIPAPVSELEVLKEDIDDLKARLLKLEKV